MKDKSLGIIGSKGKMAQWFLRQFGDSFKETFGFDLDSKESLESFVQACDLIVVSVPISKTTGVIESLAPYVSSKTCVVDLTSLKEAPCMALKSLACDVIGMHPLFGPTTERFDQYRMVMCQIKPTPWEQQLAKLFNQKGLSVLNLSAIEHDRAMAIVQVLSHGLYLSLGSVAKKEKISALSQLKTPSFNLFFRGLENILDCSPTLYQEIAFLNPHSSEVLKAFLKELESYLKIVENQDTSAFNQLFKQLQSTYPLRGEL